MNKSVPMLSDAKLAAIVLLLCFSLNMVGKGVADTYLVFMLPLEDEFGWSRSSIASVYSIYMLANGLSAPFAGMFYERWGPKVLYLSGLTVMASAFMVAGNLTSLWQFQLCIGLAAGIGMTALGVVPATTLVSRWFISNTSSAIGLVYAGAGAGSLLIVPLAQHLIVGIGWRETYFWLALIFIVLMACVMLAPWRRISHGREGHIHPHNHNEPSISLDVLKRAFKTPAYWSLIQVFFFTALAVYTILVHVIAFLVDTGFSPIQAATAFGFGGILSVLGVSTSGWLADRLGARGVVTASFALTLIGVMILYFLSYEPLLWLLMLYVLIFGISQGARGPIVASLCAKFFPGQGLATIYGTIYASIPLGSAVGAFASGWLHDISGGYRAGFVLSMVSILMAVAPFWWNSALKKHALRAKR
jgi:predicted MFS family arabinose efflux permease